MVSSGWRLVVFFMVLARTSILEPSDCLGAAGGESGATFLNLGAGARAEGMGGAFTGLADDFYALKYNPAGLGALVSVEAGFFYRPWVAGLDYTLAGISVPLGALGTVAASAVYLGSPPIDSYDSLGQRTSSFSASNGALGLSYGVKLVRGFYIGVSGRVTQERLAEIRRTAASFDFGVLQNLSRSLRWGFFAGNLGRPLKGIAESSRQASVLRLGISGRFLENKITGSLDWVSVLDDDSELKAGLEYRPSGGLALRGGYSYEVGGRSLSGISGITGGLGFRVKFLTLDYAVAPWGDLGTTHLFGVGYKGPSRGRALAKSGSAVPESRAETPDRAEVF